MSQLQTLREERAKVITEARSFIDQAADVEDDAEAAQLEERSDKALARASELDTKIERLERLERQERAIQEEQERQREERRPNGAAAEQRGTASEGAPTYSQVFYKNLRSMAPNSNIQLSAEERAILSQGETRAQTAGTDSQGGFTVPTDLLQQIIVSMKAYGPMYNPGVTTELVTGAGNTITMPTVNDTTSTTTDHTEGATLTDDGGKDVVFGEKQLDSFAYNTEWLRISKELLDDSDFNIQTLLAQLLGERMGRKANLELTVGTGSGAPNGVVTASTLGKTFAAAAAFTGDELIDLFHSVDPAYRVGPRVAWMFNDATLAAVRKLKDGDGNYLWSMGDVRGDAPGTLLGRPTYINQDMADVGASAKSFLFGDFGKYFVRKVGAPLIGAISDKDFWPGVGIAGYIRFDGELADNAAIKHGIFAAS